MADSELGEDLKRFIAEYIESVERLEILLLLARNAEKAWTASEVYQHIQSSMASVGQKLGELATTGFAKREGNGCFRYEANSPQRKVLVEELDKAYRTLRIKVIEAIFSKRSEQIQKFADAFKIKKDNP
jgi:hypothetical protein